MGASGVTGSVSLRSTARPPGFRHVDGDLSFQGTGGCRCTVEFHRKRCLAGCICAREVFELLADCRHVVIEQPESVAREAGALLGARNRYLAGEFENRSGRPIRK